MIYKREEYVQEDEKSERHPLKQIEAMIPVGKGETRYIGRVTIGLQTPMGVQSLPVNFEIPASSIPEAFSKFDGLAEQEIERARKELQEQISELRRQAQSRIITPDEIAPPGMGGPKIQF